MTALTGCEVQDLFCAARPASVKHAPGALVACFVCGRRVCLSCSVRIPVELPVTRRLLGTHSICHGCAPRVVGGLDAVRIHMTRLGGRGVPSQAPETPDGMVRWSALSSPLPITPPPKAPPKRKRKPKPTPADTQRERAKVALFGLRYDNKPLDGLRAVPADYPEARRKALGYGS